MFLWSSDLKYYLKDLMYGDALLHMCIYIRYTDVVYIHWSNKFSFDKWVLSTAPRPAYRALR